MTEQTPASVAGFTIGPLGDVLRHARKTRELWFGSYLFSWYMETLIGRLAEPEVRFLTPYVPESGPAPASSTVGKFPDRFVAASSLSPDELFRRIGRANHETMEIFAGILGEVSAREVSDFGGVEIDASPEAVSHILRGYLQTRFFALPGAEVDMEKPVETADGWLNTLEESLRFDTGRGRHTCSRCKTLPGAVRVRETGGDGTSRRTRRIPMCPICLAKYRGNRIDPLLARVAAERVVPDKKGRGRMLYPTLQEIAARELYEKHNLNEIDDAALSEKRADPAEDDADLSFAEIEGKIGHKIPAAFRYVAVVQADGDRLGRLAGRLKNPEALSHRLFQFAEAAEKIVGNYGGIPIFIGGDDLLAFLPVFYNGHTVIDFAEELSEEYRRIVNTGLPEDQSPSTLSLGINVVYYKFPLSTALGEAEGLLFGNAKADRNSVALQLTRHSGSRMGMTLRLGEEEFSLFRKLLRDVLIAAAEKAQKKAEKTAGSASREDAGTPTEESAPQIEIPGGLSYNLGRYKALLAALPDEKRLSAFFENNFNEGDHSRFETGLCRVCRMFTHYLFERVPTAEPPADSAKPEKVTPESWRAVSEVLAVLKFIKFLTGEEEDR